MRIKEEVKVVEQTVKTYIAEDGTEFQFKCDCEDYERKQKFELHIAEAEKLRVPELDDYPPISWDSYINNENSFRWYKVENEEDLETLRAAQKYPADLELGSVAYPELVCVETCGYEPYMDDVWGYTLSGCMADTEGFWKQMGYKVTLEKM